MGDSGECQFQSVRLSSSGSERLVTSTKISSRWDWQDKLKVELAGQEEASNARCKPRGGGLPYAGHLTSVPCRFSTTPLLLRETNSKPSCRAPSARATSSGDGPCTHRQFL